MKVWQAVCGMFLLPIAGWTAETTPRSSPASGWFAPEMLRGAYLPRRPVQELGGRFFITYDDFCWRGYRRSRSRREPRCG